jgi:formamidopyrimidine-DNA glycosylase
MPELPEVETVVRTLRPLLIGRKIRSIEKGKHHLRQRWWPEWNRLLAGCTIENIHRRGKWILLQLSRPQHWLLVHLGMTGRLHVQPSEEDRLKHTHFVFALDDGKAELRFLDPRRFGSVQLAQSEGRYRFPNEAELGPEPFELKHQPFFESLRRSKRALKAILMDQTIVAGLGNIYADEALFDAKLPPTKLGTTLTTAEAERLRKAIVKVLNRAIGSNGSTIANFYYGDNQSGAYQKEFRVYDQTGKPCRRCHTPIKRIRLAGRSTHFCPNCQKKKEPTRTKRQRSTKKPKTKAKRAR